MGGVYMSDGCSGSLEASDYKFPKLVAVPAGITVLPPSFGIDKGGDGVEKDVANAITAREDRGVSRRRGEGAAVCIPVLTPERSEKRQNGRRMKDDGEPMFTLTAQDLHGVALGVEPIGGINYKQKGEFQHGILEGVSRALRSETHDNCVALGVLRKTRSEFGKKNRKAFEAHEMEMGRGEYMEEEIREDGVSNTLSTVTKDNQVAFMVEDSENLTDAEGEHPPIYVDLEGTGVVYCRWYYKYGCYVAIRRLTERECFRLQAFTDEDFDRAAFVNSGSQLYKQAGNSVTVSVVAMIARAIRDAESVSEEGE